MKPDMFSMIPIMGIFKFLTRLTLFITSSCTIDWGVVTIITPSNDGMVCNTVKGISPVHGGLSMINTSRSPYTTSPKNCFIAPVCAGPLHITGVSKVCKRNPIDITLMPFSVSIGTMLSSSNFKLLPSTPNIFGTFGPCISDSKIPVLYPFFAKAAAILTETVDLPTPLFHS